jgi:hypothetical protein
MAELYIIASQATGIVANADKVVKAGNRIIDIRSRVRLAYASIACFQHISRGSTLSFR